jgi:hypothetical protein
MNNQNNKTIFSVSTEDIQREAIRLIKRKLSEEELDLAIKGIDHGLSTDISTVFYSAICEAIK